MSVQKEDATNSITYSYSSTNASFNIPFLVKYKDNIKVYLGNDVLSSGNYAYADSQQAGIYGVITLTSEGIAAYNAAETSLKIIREVPITQQENFSSQASYGSAAERGLDKLTLIAQDTDLRLSNVENISSNQPYEKALRIGIDEQIRNDIPNLILPQDRKGKILAFDADGSVDPKNVSSDSGLEVKDTGLGIKLDGNTLSKSISGVRGNYQSGSGVTVSGNTISAKSGDSTIAVDSSGIRGNYQSGNGVTVSGNAISANVVDNVTSDSPTNALSANQGKILNNSITDLDYSLATVAKSGSYNDLKNPLEAGDNIQIIHDDITGSFRVSANVPTPGEIVDTLKNASDTERGVVMLGENIKSDGNGKIFISDASETERGVVQIGEHINVGANGLISVNIASESELGVTYKPTGAGVVSVNDTNVVSCDVLNAIADESMPWTQAQAMPSATNWNSVAYGNGRFVAIDNIYDAAAYSDDGITWTQAQAMPAATRWSSVAYGNGRFVAVSGFGSESPTTIGAYSDDGITWTQTTMPAEDTWSSVAYGNNRFVAVAGHGTAAYSDDGITWTQTTTLADAGWYSLAYGNGRFVAISGSRNAAYSNDGITWTQTQAMPSAAGWSSITYGNGRFVAIAGYSKNAAYSDDGITWTQTQAMPSATSWSSITYGNDRFVAVAHYSKNAAYSNDGITWTQTTMPSDTGWSSITYGNDRFVAIGSFKVVAYITASKIAKRTLSEMIQPSRIMKLVYPVGSIMMRYDLLDPAQLEGLEDTTWAQISEGYYAKTATSSIGKIGGSLSTRASTSGGASSTTKTSTSVATTLTSSQIPSHTHGMNIRLYQIGGDDSQAGIPGNTIPSSRELSYNFGSTSATGGGQGHTHGIPALEVNSHTHTIPALNIDPAYIQLAFWRRTA